MPVLGGTYRRNGAGTLSGRRLFQNIRKWVQSLLFFGNEEFIDRTKTLIGRGRLRRKREAEVSGLVGREDRIPAAARPIDIGALREEALRCVDADVKNREYRKAVHAYETTLSSAGEAAPSV
jgi:hypothetical protein